MVYCLSKSCKCFFYEILINSQLDRFKKHVCFTQSPLISFIDFITPPSFVNCIFLLITASLNLQLQFHKVQIIFQRLFKIKEPPNIHSFNYFNYPIHRLSIEDIQTNDSSLNLSYILIKMLHIIRYDICAMRYDIKVFECVIPKQLD